ncbi:MAG: dihydrolipoyl dehydrogenase [Candidatus Riflebacteria bacterium RBG_13_59_9]|nr:MAG: dihydrolipoyl dehydrogenase [Candidatus Riflebacteria bacterium RBG_13_59_9]
MQEYDLVVIGAGPGGYVAAIRAAQLGLRTAIAERKFWGGVCLNVGCIPSKCLLEDSHLYQEIAKHGSSRGITFDGLRPDWKAMQARKDKVVSQLTCGVDFLLKKNGVEQYFGEAQFLQPNVLAVASPEGERIELGAQSFIVATGSASADLPDIKADGERVITSTEALSLPGIPESLAVIGAGAIGLEIGSVYARLGTKVTFVEIMDQCVPGMDKELAETLLREFKKERIPLHLESRVAALERAGERVRLKVEGKFNGEIEADRVLLSVGRRPVTDGLGLESIGVRRDERGFILVDESLRTSVPHIMAIGDVIGGPQLAHKASHEGLDAAEILAGLPRPPRRLVPLVVYTFPEAASVGLLAEQASAAGHEVKQGKFSFSANGRALAMNAPSGFVKVIADARTNELLGVHAIGPAAGELIHEAAVALAARMKLADYASVMRAHPTLAEAFGEAALSCDGRAIHKLG